MTVNLKLVFSLTFALYVGLDYSQNTVKDTNVIYHISYIGGPPSKHQHTLEWFTEGEMPNTHFVIQHFCWNKWVNKGKITCSGTPGKHTYKQKMPPHTGENIFRLLVLNDSNVRISTSKEFKMELLRYPLPKVNYTNKKGTKEIQFTSETDYELLDSNGKLLMEGRGTSLSYAKLDEGTYTLHYDNATATFMHTNK